MGALWDRLWQGLKRAGRAVREVFGQAFVPSDARYTSAEERLRTGAWIDINIYGKSGAMRYEGRTLYVRYPVGRMYGYMNCSRGLARSLLRAGQNRSTPAGGTWVWDHLRIRGTKLGHQKAYREFPGWSP